MGTKEIKKNTFIDCKLTVALELLGFFCVCYDMLVLGSDITVQCIVLQCNALK